MSDPVAILARARDLGLRLSVESNRISIRPARLCPADLLGDIRAHKPALLDLLQAEVVRLAPDQRPWLHVARQVLAGEFDGGDRSLTESLWIGLRGIAHPRCQEAKERLDATLRPARKEAN